MLTSLPNWSISASRNCDEILAHSYMIIAVVQSEPSKSIRDFLSSVFKYEIEKWF